MLFRVSYSLADFQGGEALPQGQTALPWCEGGWQGHPQGPEGVSEFGFRGVFFFKHNSFSKLVTIFARFVNSRSQTLILFRIAFDIILVCSLLGGSLCVIAGDISPIDVVTHLPVLCEDIGIPYCFVPSKEVSLKSQGSMLYRASHVMEKHFLWRQRRFSFKTKSSHLNLPLLGPRCGWPDQATHQCCAAQDQRWS